MTSAAARSRVSLFIATPAYGGVVAVDYVGSLFGTIELLGSQGIQVIWLGRDGESLIQRARDNLVATFLSNPGASHLLFIDADIVWRPSDVLRMIEHDKDVCCGIYRLKSDDVEFACCPLEQADGSASICPRTGCVELDLAASGFMMIKREVFLRWIAAYPESRIRRMADVEPDVLAWLHDFFPVFVDEDGILLSEDYGFCRRFREIGGQIWCDADVELAHVGRKVYGGRLRSTMRPMPGVVRA